MLINNGFNLTVAEIVIFQGFLLTLTLRKVPLLLPFFLVIFRLLILIVAIIDIAVLSYIVSVPAISVKFDVFA